MALEVKFEDFSLNVKAELNDETIAALYESAGEIESSAKRNSRVGKIGGGKTKGSWSYVVDEANGEASIGSNAENAIWEEFGTGEYALEGKGRKGGWYIKIGSGSNEISQSTVDAYGFKTVFGKGGIKYAFTKGKKPNRSLYNAYNSKKNTVQRIFESHLKGLS